MYLRKHLISLLLLPELTPSLGAIITTVIASLGTWFLARSGSTQNRIDKLLEEKHTHSLQEVLARHAGEFQSMLIKRIEALEREMAELQIMHSKELAGLRDKHNSDIAERDRQLAAHQRRIRELESQVARLQDSSD